MILEFVGALSIGLTLGLLGSGGSTLTVPILLYVVGHDAKQSIAESMAIVGTIAAVSAIPYGRAEEIRWRFVGYFGIPGMLGALGGSWLGGYAPAKIQLIVFGAVLIVAAAFMFRGRNPESVKPGEGERPSEGRAAGARVIPFGVAVGALTGFVGVGGGFLIVPSLMLLGGISIRYAIGTSLVIIALNASVGLAKYQHYLTGLDASIDWSTVFVFALIGCVGGYLGRLLNIRLNTRALEQAFAVFLLVLGGLIMLKESRQPTIPAAPKSAAEAPHPLRGPYPDAPGGAS